MWRGGTSEDGWSLASGAGTWGTQELVHQSVVQKAVYDVDIKFGLKVLGHQGMGLVRWPLWGWMEFAIWSRGHWGNHGLRQRVVQNVVYDVDIEHDFGVLGHQGMGLARSPLWGWMEFAIWSTALGHPRTCAPKCGAKCHLWCGYHTFVLGSLGTKGWVSRGWPSRNGWSLPSGAETWGTLDLCANVWCKTPFMIWTSNLVFGS